MKPAERPAARHLVGHVVHAFGNAGAGIAADDQQVRGQLRQFGKQAVEDGPALDDEGALVVTAEADRPAAGQYRGAR